ncbi:MAG: rhomboid family intramembrane serine protease [Oscillospiraceae bacterium]
MKWLYKLERKFGRFAIPNLMMMIIIGQGMVFIANMINPNINIIFNLSLFWPAVMHGQIWRLLTFIFIPATSNVIGLIFTLYLYYIIGHTLENEWGEFKFNVYYLCGILGAIVAAVISGQGTNTYINISLFLAFASLYPDFELLMFFILPVKMKYLAFMAAVYYFILFIFGGWADKAAIVFSLINYFIFFGGDFFKTAKQELKYAKTRRAWRNGNNNNKW